MDRRSYSARPLVIVDENGTVKPEVSITARSTDSSRFRKGTPWDSSPMVHTRARCLRPDVRRLSTVRPLHRRLQSCAIQLFADPERARSTVADRLASAGRKHESLPRSIRSSPGICTAGRTGFLLAGLHRSDAGGGVNTIPADNYYNPFGVDVPFINRRLVEAGNRRIEQEVDVYRALIGLEGSVAHWTWEVALQSAKAEATAVDKGFVALSRWATLWAHQGWMTQAASCAARPIPQPGASLRPASFPTACHSISSAEWGASPRNSWRT